MSRKIVNAELNNLKTTQMYYRQMLELAENVFEFKGLPEYIDTSFLNKVLVRQRTYCFFL